MNTDGGGDELPDPEIGIWGWQVDNIKPTRMVFWQNEKYRGVLVDGVIHPYVLLSGYTNGKVVTYGDYPSKERMLKEQPDLANYTQIDLDVNADWRKFFGSDNA